jgi:FkbM family methyltransferase
MAWTPDGYLLLPAEDLRLLAAMSEGGVLEHGTRLVLAALLEPGGAFLDVGAHVGTMALLGARRVGEHGRVFAVEPLPRLAALLRRSMALNDLADRVSVAACAAGEADAEGLLHLGEVLGHSSLLPLSSAPKRRSGAGARPADRRRGARRHPDRRREDRRRRVRVAGVARDAAGAGREPPPRRRAGVRPFAPRPRRHHPEAWLGELEAAGFASYTIDEATGACRPASAPALAGVFSTNVLLLRPGAAARHPGLVFA